MQLTASILSAAMLFTSIQCAPGPAPDQDAGVAMLRRAANSIHARQFNADNVPFKIDKKWCLWSPKGGCYMNEASAEAWKLLKQDPPKYEWDDYAAEEGVYVSGEAGWDGYIEWLYGFYQVVNEHAPYDEYKYDYKKYIEEYDDPYCVWKWNGDCWLNDMADYVNGTWEKDPYKLVRRQSDKEDWSVYATSKGIQADFSKWGWDLFMGLSKWGPLQTTEEDFKGGDGP